ncbi:MAG: hypothetical protein OEY28_01110 [Nitrospira sp.]|nr:hypothetical protein [Nitrospira sp.]
MLRAFQLARTHSGQHVCNSVAPVSLSSNPLVEQASGAACISFHASHLGPWEQRTITTTAYSYLTSLFDQAFGARMTGGVYMATRVTKQSPRSQESSCRLSLSLWTRHRRNRVSASLLCMVTGITILSTVDTAHAIPAFARKYNVNCTTCHTAPPRLNTFGERFLENGYQLPGTGDRGILDKTLSKDATLDEVGHYLGFRLRGNVLRDTRYKREHPPATEPGIVKNSTDLAFPETFSLFTAGSLSTNIGFFVELEAQLQEKEVGIERAFLTINNLIRQDLAHVRVGLLDPSAASSFSTMRQQLDSVGESLHPSSHIVQRAGLTPLAAAAKFYGLLDRSGQVISPYAASLYNSASETGIEIRGRPFGDWLQYQIGLLNGSHEGFGDSNKGKDLYGALRLDYARSSYLSASVTGFIYVGNGNVLVADGAGTRDVNWHRVGIGAHARYKMLDVHGMITLDTITRIPAARAATFDTSASGFTLAVDTHLSNQTLVSLRYDHMDAGGDITQRTSQSFVGLQIKHYVRDNIALYARNDINVRRAENGDAAARNLRNAVFVGIDVAY